MSRSEYYYVAVFIDSSELRFITSVDYSSKVWRYDVNESPLAMKESAADSLAEALLMNMVIAVVVKSAIPLVVQPGSGRTKEGEKT